MNSLLDCALVSGMLASHLASKSESIEMPVLTVFFVLLINSSFFRKVLVNTGEILMLVKWFQLWTVVTPPDFG